MPSAVNVTVNGQTISAKGPKGELSITIHDDVTFEHKDNVLTFKPSREDNKASMAMTGTMRSLVNNIISGVEQGYYTYNGLGQRTSKIVAGSSLTFTYGLNGELLSESDGTTTLDYVYLNGQPLAVIDAARIGGS